MRAAEFASLVGARRTGTGRWLARCPAHDDHSPSLSISEGRDGRVLVRCWAGCCLDEILNPLKLRRRDLFQGPPPCRAQLATLEAERKAREHKRRAQRMIEREAWDKVRQWEAAVNALGAKLAHTPDGEPSGDRLARIFHNACEQLGKAESAALAISGIKEAA